MKKIFTLIAAALMAVSANAKVDFDYSALLDEGTSNVITFNSWEWKGIIVSQGDLIEDQDAKTCDDSQVTYFDASAYDYLILEMEEASCNPQLIIQYKCLGTIGQWGAEFDTDQVSGSMSGLPSMIAIKLNADKKKTVNQIAIQPTSAGSIKVAGFYWATAEEYEQVAEQYKLTRPAEGESVAIWKSTLVFDGWGVYTTIPAEKFSIAQVGDIIRCHMTDVSSPNPVFKIGGTWDDFPGLQRDIKDTYFQGVIASEDVLATLKEKGLSLQGMGFTLTQVDLYVPEAPKEYEAEGKALTITDGCNILATEFAGYSDDAKVVFVTTVTGAASYINWGNGEITSIGGAVKAGNMSITGEGDNEKVFLLKELKEALDSPGFYIDEETGEEVSTDSGLFWNTWGFNDDCTSTRKSCTIYEVVGFEGEGYVPAGTNAISNVQAAKTQSAAIFNLAGQQVSKAVKGIYIQNGKKFVVK